MPPKVRLKERKIERGIATRSKDQVAETIAVHIVWSSSQNGRKKVTGTDVVEDVELALVVVAQLKIRLQHRVGAHFLEKLGVLGGCAF